MIQITNLRQFNRAKLRASVASLQVTESTVDRQWRVFSPASGNTYRVTYMQGADGRRFGTCECKGAQGGYVCKHMGAVLPMAFELALTVEARERVRAAAMLPQLPKWSDPEEADADCDPANWQ